MSCNVFGDVERPVDKHMCTTMQMPAMVVSIVRPANAKAGAHSLALRMHWK